MQADSFFYEFLLAILAPPFDRNRSNRSRRVIAVTSFVLKFSQSLDIATISNWSILILPAGLPASHTS
jgi:hypothetical protein